MNEIMLTISKYKIKSPNCVTYHGTFIFLKPVFASFIISRSSSTSCFSLSISKSNATSLKLISADLPHVLGFTCTNLCIMSFSVSNLIKFIFYQMQFFLGRIYNFAFSFLSKMCTLISQSQSF